MHLQQSKISGHYLDLYISLSFFCADHSFRARAIAWVAAYDARLRRVRVHKDLQTIQSIQQLLWLMRKVPQQKQMQLPLPSSTFASPLAQPLLPPPPQLQQHPLLVQDLLQKNLCQLQKK